MLEHLLHDRRVAEVDRLVREVVEGGKTLEHDAVVGPSRWRERAADRVPDVGLAGRVEVEGELRVYRPLPVEIPEADPRRPGVDAPLGHAGNSAAVGDPVRTGRQSRLGHEVSTVGVGMTRWPADRPGASDGSRRAAKPSSRTRFVRRAMRANFRKSPCVPGAERRPLKRHDGGGRDYHGTDAQDQIVQLYGDSSTFDFSAYFGKVDLV